MPKSKFETIYKDLKRKIEEEEYRFQELMPSENTLVSVYDCSRNTIRRAVGILVNEGYVQSLHGKGVRVIYQPAPQTDFTMSGIETMKESAIRNHKTLHTDVIQFGEIVCDERTSRKTGYAQGERLTYIQRVRYLDGRPLILDNNMFLASAVPGLTREIAAESVYEYIEQVLEMPIVTSKRTLTVEHATQMDEKYLDLNGYDCMAVITSRTYNADGVMFEYTQSRHCPENFSFQSAATRKKL